VQVCPTGIDIRNGLQYECIACGACIDACDAVMDKVGYPKGLIRYSTQNAIDGKPTRVLRPRILVYGTILLALMLGWGWGVTHRSPLIAEVLRDRNALYRETATAGRERLHPQAGQQDRPAAALPHRRQRQRPAHAAPARSARGRRGRRLGGLVAADPGGAGRHRGPPRPEDHRALAGRRDGHAASTAVSSDRCDE
jgi:ferredoxin